MGRSSQGNVRREGPQPRAQDLSTPLDWGPLVSFVRESNAIEGILREPTTNEIRAHERLFEKFQMTVAALCEFQAIIAPDKPLRAREGLNVRVGSHIAPPGGPAIEKALRQIVKRANSNADAWETHIAFEMLHPFLDGNGRTGRALWAWQMHGQDRSPFAISFLHRFYYQTLAHHSATRLRAPAAPKASPQGTEGESPKSREEQQPSDSGRAQGNGG